MKLTASQLEQFELPGYIAHRDFTPVRCLPDDCLPKHYEVALPCKDGNAGRRTAGHPEDRLT